MSKAEIIKPLHGLRGIAALTVIVGHLSPIRSAPSLGVLLFFLISGFLIGKLYMEREFTPQQVWQYVVARLARIYPLFAVVIVGTGLLNWVIPSANVFHLSPDQVVQHLLFAGSAFTVWTISVEFQFYALFVLIWFLRSKATSAGTVLYPLLGLAILAMLWVGPEAGRIDLLRYLHLFVLGLVIARVTTSELSNWRPASAMALPVFCAAYGLAFLLVPRFYDHEHVYRDPVAIAICTGILVASLVARECWVNRLLSLPVLVWLGEVSFSIYLLHRHAQWIVDSAFPDLSKWQSLPMKIALTLVFAQIAAWLIEKPTRSRMRHWGNRIGNAPRSVSTG